MSNKFIGLFKRNIQPLAIFVLALLVTLVCWHVALDQAQAEKQQAFERTTRMYRQVLERRIDAYVNFLTDLSSLFMTDDDGFVSSREFTAFVSNANIMRNYPGTNRIGYLPLVPASQKGQHEARMRAAGFPGYRIRAQGLPEYFPYTYLYPMDGAVRRQLLGSDPHQQPDRDKAMEEARDANAVIATGKLGTLIWPSTQSSFLLYAPIYRWDAPKGTIAERRHALKGYVFAAFRADKFIYSAWGNDLNRIASVRFYDGDKGPNSNLLYDSDTESGPRNNCTQCLTHVETINAAGRQWALEFRARPTFYKTSGLDKPTFILMGGLLASLLLAGIAAQRNGQRLLARRQQEQDQQFRSLFDQNPDAVYSLTLDGHFFSANAATLAMTGRSREALKATSFRQIVAPDALPVALELFEQSAKGMPSHGDLAIIGQDGSRIEMAVNSLPIMVNGHVVGVFGIAKDITQRKRAEAESRQMRQFLDAIIDNLPVALFAKEAKSLRFIAWNKANEKIIGLPHEEVIGKNDYELFSREDADYFTAVDRDVLNSWEPLEGLEETVQTRDKGDRLLHTRKVPFRMGEDAYLLGISEDITENRLAAAELYETKQMLEKVLNNIPQRVFWKDLNLVYMGGNQHWLKDTGHDQPIGKTDYDMPWKDRAEKFRADDQEVIRLDQPKINYEETMILPDGGLVWLRTSKIPLHDQSGQVIGIMGSYEDITLQKQAEEALHKAHAQLEVRVLERTAELRQEIEIRKETEKALRESQATLQKIIETMPVGIWIADRGGRIVAMNPEAQRIWGRAELVSPDQYELYKGWNPKTGKCLAADEWFLARAIQCGESIREEVIEIEAFDGVRKKILMSAYPLLDENHQVIGAIALNQDVTERFQHEEELRLLSAHLQTIREDERTRIAREIHDELGGVLAAVKFDLSIPIRRNGDVDASGISRRNQETIRLVDNAIVALRRIMSDLRPSVLDDLGLWAALEWQAMEFESRMGITTTFKLKGEEVTIEPNLATALFRMTQESLNNVAKHAQASRVAITATAEDQNIIIRIRDNGRGINAKDLQQPKSFGIKGMNERARAFHGTVKINGRPGEGTTVSIKFPMGDASRTAAR